jgi:hypothetical protein
VIIGEKIEEDDRDKDLEAWRWLRDIIERLGVNGMSSEESDVETNAEGLERVVYNVKLLVWRRDIEEELEIIDKCCQYAKANGTRGTTPHERRRRARNRQSNRDPVPGLPEILYDKEWLQKQSRQYRELTLRVSKEEFQWLKLKKRGGARD